MSEGNRSRDELTADGLYYEYSKAANPVGAGLIPPVALGEFPSRLHEEGETRVIPFDLSDKLQCPGPATSPSLCANFLKIEPGESLETRPNASAQLFYVLRGRGTTEFDGESIPWEAGDIFTLPSGGAARHRAKEDAAFYWVHDEPLLRYLGAEAKTPRFRPTLYLHDRSDAELKKVEQDPEARRRSRVSVLLGNSAFPQTRTINHVLWAMYGVLPVDAVQLPHHHKSVAIDLIIACKPGCYSMIGESVDDEGRIRNPRRADWKAGSAFVTPPGLWHSHHNESGEPAHLMPIQDAGLHTYLRTLDIHFFDPDRKARESLKK